ncbi:MAG: PAS domain S-box protein [Bacteroidetes bacterium]|nr:PAS domain S-box protein [Bacteroidota bacterium]
MSASSFSQKVSSYWNRLIRIGRTEGMDMQQEVRMQSLNALMVIVILILAVWVTINSFLGAYTAFRSLLVVPVLLLVIYCNYKRKYDLAAYIMSYAILFIVLFLSVTERRTGTQYILVGIGCCSVLIFDRPASAWLSFVIAFGSYIFYYWYDSTHPFVANPTIPYAFAQNALMFLSGLIVVSQSMVFRSLVKRYEAHLRDANREIETINEELRASNEELHSFSENLDSLVRQKEAHLQAYMDGIDISMYATVSDMNGKFMRVNERVLAISGYSEAELVGKDYRILSSGNYPESFFIERRNVLMQGNVWRGEIEHRTKDGALVWLDCVVIPIRDLHGDIQSFLTLGLSITEKKLHDKMQQETIQLLESIAFSASHKIRGPLARIKGLSNLITKDIVNEHEFKMVAEKLVISSEELDAATSELVEYVFNHQEKINDRTDAT